MMKVCISTYIWSGSTVTGQRKALFWSTTCCYPLFKENGGTPALRVDFAKGDGSLDLNGLYTNSRIQGML